MADAHIGQIAPEPIVDAIAAEADIAQVAVEPIVDALIAAEARIAQIAVEVIRTFGCEGVAAVGGIYKIVPGKRQDTLWVDITAEATEDVKIPDPQFKTSLLGS